MKCGISNVVDGTKDDTICDGSDRDNGNFSENGEMLAKPSFFCFLRL